MIHLAAMLYESPAVVALGPIGAALFVGFAVLMPDGQVYRTELGEEYLRLTNATIN